nr:hypothetical protein [Tanacetum cinerariifolium]
MEIETTQTSTTAKLPMLKQGDNKMWRLRIEQYFQPLPTADSPIADSLRYIPKSDLEEDPEEDPTDYPADEGDDDDDDESSDNDEDDDDDDYVEEDKDKDEDDE